MTKLSEALAAPVIALVVYALLHVVGIGMVVMAGLPQEGAASLASGHGYTYLSGEPVRAWAPLYSCTWRHGSFHRSCGMEPDRG